MPEMRETRVGHPSCPYRARGQMNWLGTSSDRGGKSEAEIRHFGLQTPPNRSLPVIVIHFPFFIFNESQAKFLTCRTND